MQSFVSALFDPTGQATTKEALLAEEKDRCDVAAGALFLTRENSDSKKT